MTNNIAIRLDNVQSRLRENSIRIADRSACSQLIGPAHRSPAHERLRRPESEPPMPMPAAEIERLIKVQVSRRRGSSSKTSPATTTTGRLMSCPPPSRARAACSSIKWSTTHSAGAWAASCTPCSSPPHCLPIDFTATLAHISSRSGRAGAPRPASIGAQRWPLIPSKQRSPRRSPTTTSCSS